MSLVPPPRSTVKGGFTSEFRMSLLLLVQQNVNLIDLTIPTPGADVSDCVITSPPPPEVIAVPN